ncbi:hypothetical protein B0H13DRAFT_1894758 [Mycena leptocephala]|nr:hypothetical protein B0H13DRAFT_1894758 [Mycena leptocephala]
MSDNRLLCHHSQYSADLTPACPAARSIELHSLGSVLPSATACPRYQTFGSGVPLDAKKLKPYGMYMSNCNKIEGNNEQLNVLQNPVYGYSRDPSRSIRELGELCVAWYIRKSGQIISIHVTKKGGSIWRVYAPLKPMPSEKITERHKEDIERSSYREQIAHRAHTVARQRNMRAGKDTKLRPAVRQYWSDPEQASEEEDDTDDDNW